MAKITGIDYIKEVTLDQVKYFDDNTNDKKDVEQPKEKKEEELPEEVMTSEKNPEIKSNRIREKKDFDLIYKNREQIIGDNKNNIMVNISEKSKEILDYVSFVLEKGKKETLDVALIEFFINNKDAIKTIEKNKLKINKLNI